MFKDFLENRIVDIKENLIMSSLQSDMDNSINKGDECTESVPNIMPLCLFLVRELKRDLRDLTERVSSIPDRFRSCTTSTLPSRRKSSSLRRSFAKSTPRRQWASASSPLTAR